MCGIPKLVLCSLIINCFLSFGQQKDSLNLKVVYGTKSYELQQLLSFEGVDYMNIKIHGEILNGKTVMLTSEEFWRDKDSKIDTILEMSKTPRPLLNKDTLELTVINKKISIDTLKIDFRFKNLFNISKRYKTTRLETYDTRDLSNGKSVSIDYRKPVPLLVYSLPYERRELPGYLFYCELTRDGIPPKKWASEFNLLHYIVFYIHIQ
ncbi:MAG: hypothetical protein AAF849_00810 [Bacteroidota bacterium]